VARLGNPQAEKKVLVAANEHARELVTAEVVLRFIKTACGKPKSSQSLLQSHDLLIGTVDAKVLLKDVHFIMLPVVNVKGRALVESGKETCQRMTSKDEGFVDLNRNMDVDWGRGEKQDWGEKPFSTYQARILRDVAAEHKPQAFVDLHTGAESLMTSWGYKPKTNPDFPDQKKVLDLIKERHCPKCEIGSNRIVIAYPNPGEVIDHMYAKQKIKYSTLWEVYEGDASDCVAQFNPPDDKYEAVVDNWSGALATFGDYMRTTVDVDERARPGNFNHRHHAMLNTGLLQANSTRHHHRRLLTT